MSAIDASIRATLTAEGADGKATERAAGAATRRGGSPGQKQDIASAGEDGKFVSKGSSSDNLISGGPGPKVKSYRIDDVVGDTEKVLFFKIDVQGFEEELLKGAPSCLQNRIRAIKFEVASDWLFGQGSSPRNVYRTLQQNGSRWKNVSLVSSTSA